jgi:fumarate hydratase subunit alpha
MDANELKDLIIEEAVKSTYILPEGLQKNLEAACCNAEGIEKKVLKGIVGNIKIAEENSLPACQDTGVFEIWVNIGQEASIDKLDLDKTILQAIQEAHKVGGLRKSMPEIKPVVHYGIIEGRNIEFVITPRGFGSENYSFLHMMNPEATFEDIKKQILEDVRSAGGRPCPPYLIGVGIGGTASKAVEMSTQALTEIDFNHSEHETELLKQVNAIGTGAGGMGGRYTALGIKIKEFPQHIAGLAVGVHIGCWCNRVRRFQIEC